MGRGKWQWRSRDVPAVDPRRGLTTGRPARYPRLTRGLPVAPCSTRRMPFHECGKQVDPGFRVFAYVAPYLRGLPAEYAHFHARKDLAGLLRRALAGLEAM